MARPNTDSAGNGPESVATSSSGPGRRELIIVGEPDAELRVTPTAATSLSGAELGALADVASDPAVVIRPLFGASEERVLAAGASDDAPTHSDGTGPPLAEEMSRFHHVDAPDERLDELAQQLQASP